MEKRFSIISRMSALFAQGARAYCAAAAIAGVIGVGLTLALFLGLTPQNNGEPFDPVTLWRSMTFGEKIAMLVGLLLAVWLPVLLGARGVCRITFNLLAARKPSPASILIDMVRFLPAAIVYSFLIGLPVLVASSFLYIPALLVASLFALVVPAGIDEAVHPRQAFKRGFSLSAKVYGKILLTAVVSVALVGVALALRVLLLDSFISGSQPRVLLIRLAVVCAPGLLVLILANICFTLLYLQALELEAGSSPQNAAGASSDR